MKYYPVFLRVASRPCLVVGGGAVAQQKVALLCRANARVTVISPELSPTLATAATQGKIVHLARPYTAGDLAGFFLVYAATDNAELHARLAWEAAERGVLLNVVDRPQLCDFITPAIVERGDLIIATSTSGSSPALARRIRRELEQTFGPEYALALQLLGRLRQQLSDRALPAGERQRILGALVDSPLVSYVRHCQSAEVDRLLESTVGAGVSLASLGMQLGAA